MALKDKFLNGKGLYSLIEKIKNFVKPNQQTSGGESNLTSLEVNGTNYKVSSSIIFRDTAVSTWVSDNTYASYAYKASVTLDGVTSDSFAQPIFSVEDTLSGDYAPIAETYNGGIYLYSKVNTAIIVPTIYILN